MKKFYIPTINISSLLDSKFTSKKSLDTIKKIEKACVKIGFFQIVGHGIGFKKLRKFVKLVKIFLNQIKKINLN